jgi:hypothetical protein
MCENIERSRMDLDRRPPLSHSFKLNFQIQGLTLFAVLRVYILTGAFPANIVQTDVIRFWILIHLRCICGQCRR